MLSSWWRLPAALHALTWLGVAASGNVDTCPNSRTSLASKRVDWSCTLADYATVPSEPVQDDPASLSIAAAEYLPEAETKSSNAASTAAPALVAQSTPRISSIIDDARAASSAATPIMEPPSPAYTPFLSFSEWRERQEQVLVKLQSNLKQPLPVPTAKPTSPDAPVSVSTLEGMTDEELRDRAVAQPVRYLQPLPASGSGAADDPLLPLSARTNYASVDCSAAVLRASKHSKGATSILFNAKDRYMLTPCSAGEKFVFVELCEEIDVDAIVLANYEFFSSMFKHVRVQGSEVYPGADGDWVTLGTLRAGNLRGLQVFKPPKAGRFFKYLRLDFLSHYGNEHFCPVSILKVYGRNQMDVFRDEEAARLSEQLNAAQRESTAVQEEVVFVTLQPHETASKPADVTVSEPTHTFEAPLQDPSVRSVPVESSPVAPITFATTLGATDHQSSTPAATLPKLSLPTSRVGPSSTSSPAGPPLEDSPKSTVPVTSVEEHIPVTSTQVTSSTLLDRLNVRTVNTTTLPSARPPPVHQPLTNGESIYGAITKRLNSLERDVALTLKYVEEQGHLFQDLFLRLESRLTEIERARARNEHSLKRLALELDFHRARVEEERIAMATQVNMLAAEIVFGKRLGVAQLIALLAILALVAFTRGSVATFVNFPLNSARKSSLFRSSTAGSELIKSALNELDLPVPPLQAARRKDKPDRVPKPINTALAKTASVKRRGQPRYSPAVGDRDARFLHSASKLARSQTPPPWFPHEQPETAPRRPLSAFKTNSITNGVPHTPAPVLAPPAPAHQLSPESAGWLSSDNEASGVDSPTKRQGLGIDDL